MAFIDEIKYRLKQYKKKYYLNILLKGSIFFLAGIITLFLGFNLLEYIGRFDSITRAVMFFGFISLSTYSLYYWILVPSYHLINLNKTISDEQAARQLGNYFPEIKDKLLNILQLNNYSASNELILASIDQKYTEIKFINFSSAVSLNENKRFAKQYLLIPLAVFGIILFLQPQLLVSSTERIVAYDRQFVADAPFKFNVINKNLHVIYNEPFTVEIELTGDKLPKEIFLYREQRKIACEKIDEQHFSFTYPKVYKQEQFYLEAAGFTSPNYTINVVAKPKISGLQIELNYPKYLNRKSEIISNNGNLLLPEGTNARWKITAEATDKCEINFGNRTVHPQKETSLFTYDSTFTHNTNYDLSLTNAYAQEVAQYNIQVVKDQYPTIQISQIQDEVYYEYIYFNGVINDDYGFTSLRLYYKKSSEEKYTSLPLKINRKSLKQSFSHKIPLDSLGIKAGEGLTYFVEVRDNDGVNKPKAARSTRFTFKLPSRAEMDENIDQKDSETAKKIENTVQKVQNHKKKMNELHNKIKGKKELEWEDKQALKKLLKEHEEIKKDINKVNNDFQENQFKKDKFQQQDENLKQKAEELQQLLEDLKNPELEKLYEELNKLLEEESNLKELNKTMEEMELKNESLEKELDRNLEMLKQLKFEQDVQQQINKLEELSKQQEELAQQNENKEIPAEQAKEEQEKINEAFEEIQKKMEDIKKNNESMQQPNAFDELKQEQEQIEESLQKSTENLEQGKQKKSAEQQKQAAQQMQNMANKMANQQQAQQAQQAEENLQHIRLLLENLVHLSFEQEELMLAFRRINQKDPRFVALSQKQIDLQDDAKIVEDSLYALAKRVFQIQAIVTQEVESMKKHMNESVTIIKKREARRASASQQYAMTSINNLALLLSEVMQKMQEQMAQQMEGNQMCKKPGNKPGQKPGISELQKQLNQQIKDLKNGQKSGRELSEKLAELAAKQEQLRRALKDMKEGNEDGGTEQGQALSNELKRLEKLMKETESDLVNKELSQRTINRQEQIMTRLLEAEKASKEREYDNQRKGTTAKELKRPNPPALEEYLKAKRKEIELIKIVPPNLQPYYKEKVNLYFNE